MRRSKQNIVSSPLSFRFPPRFSPLPHYWVDVLNQTEFNLSASGRRDHVTLPSISCSVLVLMTPNVRPTGTHQGFLIDLISFFRPAEALEMFCCRMFQTTGLSESTPLLAEDRKEVRPQWQTLTCSLCPCVLAYSQHTCEMSQSHMSVCKLASALVARCVLAPPVFKDS